MAGYGEPDWVTSDTQQNNSATVIADANVGENVAAPSGTGGYVLSKTSRNYCFTLFNSLVISQHYLCSFPFTC